MQHFNKIENTSCIKNRKSKTLGKTEFRLHIFQSPNIYGVLCDHKTTSIVSSFSSLT